MIKTATPKRVTLLDGKTFVARYERVPRSRLPPHVKIRRRYRGAPARQRGNKKVVTVWKKSSQKKIISSSAAKNLAKNLANKALDKAPDVIDNLSNRTNNKTIKKSIEC